MIKGVFFAFVLLSFALVSAQEIEVPNDAGTTPDSTIWGIDRALERIELALTFDDSEKEKKRLQNAHERILEVKQMILEDKIEDAEDAREKYTEILETSKKNIKSISSEDDSDLEEINLLEDYIQMQEVEIEDVDVLISSISSLSEEQKKLLEQFINSLGADVANVHLIINSKEDETLTNIERKTGRSRVEIIDEFGRLRDEKKLRAEVLDSYSIIEIRQKFTTRTIEREALINEVISRFTVSESDAKELLKIEDSDEIEEDNFDRLKVRIDIRVRDGVGVSEVEVEFRQKVEETSVEGLQSAVVDLSKLTKEQIMNAISIEEDSDDLENEREIEIEIKERDGSSFAKVEIEWDGMKKEFVLETADKEEIYSRIASLLGVTVEEVLKVAEFEDGENDSDEDGDSDDDEDDSEDEEENENNGNAGSNNP